MLQLFVDGDACPVKDEVYRVSTRYGIGVSLVANARIFVPAGFGVEMVVVDGALDAADDWIAARATVGDIVVTADLPLAARCIANGAYAIGHDGRAFSEDSIGDALGTRELKSYLREAGLDPGGPRPLAARDRSRFLSKLDDLVQRSLRAAGKRPDAPDPKPGAGG